VTQFIGGLGSLDILVNNAGIARLSPLLETPTETLRKILEINVVAAFVVMREAARKMMGKGGGHIINIASDAAIRGIPSMTHYAASKHALLAFSLGTLAELRAEGQRAIHISCICPDGIWTPMLHDKLDDAGAAASFTGTLLTPERVARRIGRLVDHPRPVVAIPRWRGALVRLLDTFPRASTPLAGAMLALGRAGQRRQLRRLRRASPGPDTR